MAKRADIQITTPQNVETCVGCRYAQPVVTQSENVILECYRYPAQLLVWDGEIMQAHPDAVYRCGEYKEPDEVLHEKLVTIFKNLREEREARKDGSSTHPSTS